DPGNQVARETAATTRNQGQIRHFHGERRGDRSVPSSLDAVARGAEPHVKLLARHLDVFGRSCARGERHARCNERAHIQEPCTHLILLANARTHQSRTSACLQLTRARLTYPVGSTLNKTPSGRS